MSEQPITVIAQQGNTLRAVCVTTSGGRRQVLWTKAADLGQTTWSRFAADCAAPPSDMTGEPRGTFIVGFDSAATVFYRLELPPVKEEDMASIVKLQAEAKLPIAADKMELGWRLCCRKDKNAIVTVAGARTERLRKFVDTVSPAQPAAILLSAEGLVRAWLEFFGGTRNTSVIINPGPRTTCVCLAEEGTLSNALSLDIGTDDFADPLAGERLAHDVRGALHLFGCSTKMPLYVLGDGSTPHKSFTSALSDAGFIASQAVPSGAVEFPGDRRLIYEFAVPVGLAILTLEDAPIIRLFDRLYRPLEEKQNAPRLFTIKRAGAAAAIALIILVLASYAADLAKLSAFDKYASGTGSGATFEQMKQRHALVTAIARQRQKGDVLKLLSRINSVPAEGVLLNSIDFVKDKPVTITGDAPGNDQLYKFRKALSDVPGVSNVVEQSAAEDQRTKKLRFTIKFDYKSTGPIEHKEIADPQPQAAPEQKEKS